MVVNIVGMVVVWNGGRIVGMVWNGGPQSPAGAFSAGRPSADAGLRLNANNGTKTFLNLVKVTEISKL